MFSQFADVAETQEAVTDKLKKVQKQEFSAHFKKLHDRAKACLYAYFLSMQNVVSTCLPHV
jgi:hypothetical protein